MRLAFHRKPGTNRSLEPVAWGALPVLALGVGVIVSGVGIDLLVAARLSVPACPGWLLSATGWRKRSLVLGNHGLHASRHRTWPSCSSPTLGHLFFGRSRRRGYQAAYQRTRSPRHSRRKWYSDGRNISIGGRTFVGNTAASDTPAVINDQERGPTRRGMIRRPTGRAKPSVTKPVKYPPPEATSPASPGIASTSRIVFGVPEKAPALNPSQISAHSRLRRPLPARRTHFTRRCHFGGPTTDGGRGRNFISTALVRGGWRSIRETSADDHVCDYIPGTYEVRVRFSGTFKRRAPVHRKYTLRH